MVGGGRKTHSRVSMVTENGKVLKDVRLPVSTSITYRHLGAMVRALREEKGISLREFARMIEVTPGYVSFLERNVIKSKPTERLIKRIARCLDADVDEMLAMAGKVSTEFIWGVSKHPQQIAALVRAVEDLPVGEIEALTAQALRRQEEIDEKEKGDGPGGKGKK